MTPNPATSDSVSRPLVIASAFSLILAVLKLIAFLMTGSVILLGTLLDSVSDALISLVNYRVSRLAREAPDREHPFGHGGIEVASSLFQGIILAVFGVFLAGQSIVQMRSERPILNDQQEFILSLTVTLVAAFGGFAIQLILQQMQKRLNKQRERSLSINADRGHYAGDFWFNLMNACGLVALWYFKLGWIDAAFGLAGSVMFLKSSFPIFRHGLSDILHVEASGAEQQAMVQLILGTDDQIQGVHRLRSRRSGPTLFIDFHLKLPANMSLENAHRIGERVSANIRRQFPRTDVIIHLDPDSEPDDEIW